jgi:hypothetical protein
MRDRLSPRNLLRELRRGWPDALEILKALPPVTKRLVERVQDGTFQVPIDAREIQQWREESAAQARRGDRIVIGASLLLGGVLWLGTRLQPHWLGMVSGAAGLLVWISVWLRRAN